MDSENKTVNKRGRRAHKPDEINQDLRVEMLKAARLMFAEKGYEGTSAADIANHVGVNKALVFYYFGNKENILKEVLNLAAQEAVERRELFLRRQSPFSKETIEDYYDVSLRAMEAKKEVIKILLVEAMKNSSSSNYLFDFLEKAMVDVVEKLRDQGYKVEDEEKLQTTEFFFDAMTLFIFVALEEKWAEYKGFDRKKVRSDFMAVFSESYLNYLRGKYYKS